MAMLHDVILPQAIRNSQPECSGPVRDPAMDEIPIGTKPHGPLGQVGIGNNDELQNRTDTRT